MLHGIIIEQGHWLDVQEEFSVKMHIIHIFSTKYLASVALTYGIILIAEYQAHGPLI